MTATQDRPREALAQQELGPVLRAVHKIWIAETDGYLTPISGPEASFWERWTAVRCLADDFSAQYRLERALLEELRAFLPTEVADTLLQQAERIRQLQQELDRLGRCRGTALTVSDAARLLLESVRSWCADFESAAWQIDSSELPEEAQRVLAGLKLYALVHA